MEENAATLQDIELPNTAPPNPVPLAGLALLLILAAFGLWFRLYRRNPLNRAKRQLRRPPHDPHQIAALLRLGFQVKRLEDAELPIDFLRRLEQCRFSAAPCQAKTLQDLQKQALSLLENST